MASLNLNKVVLVGRLTAQPELRQTPNGVSLTSFTIAINRRFVSKNSEGAAQQTADFINCVAWRQTAEFITRYFKKGSCICVLGSIQSRSWVDSATNTKRYALDVVVDEANFVDSNSSSQSGSMDDSGVDTVADTSVDTAPNSHASAFPPNITPQLEDVADDGELPF